jgi:Domain of unknown function (DUF4381)
MDPQPADSLVDLLDQLEDFVEPLPVPMTPQTWAWVILATILLTAPALGLLAWLRHRRATAWRRAALAELHALAPPLEAGDPAALARLQTLLRRVALATAPRAEVAPLSGDGWTRFLADTGGDFGSLARDLADAPYRPAPTFDGPAALAAARRWIRHRHA